MLFERQTFLLWLNILDLLFESTFQISAKLVNHAKKIYDKSSM